MKYSRREVIKGAIALGASAALLGGDSGQRFFGLPPSPDAPFSQGIASGFGGDPKTELILWTRIDPQSVAYQNAAVDWKVSESPNLSGTVASGRTLATQHTNYSTKVELNDLQPGRSYYYQFSLPELGIGSPIGRTHTLPDPEEFARRENQRARIVAASCQDRSDGFYTAWNKIAQLEDVDFVVFLGDFIYEHRLPSRHDQYWARRPELSRVVLRKADDIDTYRVRYELYLRDANLRAARARHPFVMMWDDHEFENDFAGQLVNSAVKRAAVKAYHEYNPVPGTDGTKLHRQFRIGDLVAFALFDTRIERSETQIVSSSQIEAKLKFLRNAWDARVPVQIVASPSPIAPRVNGYDDSWNGFPRDQLRLLDGISDLPNPYFVVGDLHSQVSMEVRVPKSRALIGWEHSSGSITSLPRHAVLHRRGEMDQSPNHGFLLIDVTPASVTRRYFHADTRNPLGDVVPDVERVSPVVNRYATFAADFGRSLSDLSLRD